MKVIGINASPRKGANTQTLVETMLAGAAEAGARTRMVNLRTMTINDPGLLERAKAAGAGLLVPVE